MRSMTGFGAGEAPLSGGRVIVEARSLNHKFLETRVKLPSELSDQTFFLEQLARERLVRGRYDLSVQLELSRYAPRLDLDRARAVYAQLAELRDELAPGTELPITTLAAVPDLFGSGSRVNAEEARSALALAFERAVTALDAMRAREGSALQDELSSRLDRVQQLSDEVARSSPEVSARLGARLRERVTRLLGDVGAQVDGGRLETEIVLLADRTDVTEELVRLRSHAAQFSDLLSSSEPIGRRLDFLLQEMGRETNTVGAKCQDAGMSHLVVDLKAELSRMREQVQNVE